jgi:ABC-type branched-subunit amino acid transport system substrate-binding protein
LAGKGQGLFFGDLQMQPSSWRVGGLFSETGVTGAIERTQRAATLLAIGEINKAGGVLGRPIEPIIYDPRSTPSLYRDMALRLCDTDRVNVIFGCHMSSARKAALPVIEARGALLFYPHLYEGFEYSRHCIYTGATPSQLSVQLVDYLIANYGKRVLLVGSDYVYPYESNRIVAGLFSGAGGQVLDEMYVPLELEKSHVTNIIERIGRAQPDVIYSTVVGDGIIPFFEAFKEAGFDARTMPIASQRIAKQISAEWPGTFRRGISPPLHSLQRSVFRGRENSFQATKRYMPACRRLPLRQPIFRSTCMPWHWRRPVTTDYRTSCQRSARWNTTRRRA